MEQIPNFRGVRVALGTGYNPAKGNRRAWRNGRVSDLPPEIPNVTIRNFSISVRHKTRGGATTLADSFRGLSVSR
jgi:hypothetical protein